MSGSNYEIVVGGRLGGAMCRWFSDLEVSSSGPDATQLCGWFPDQPALQGLIAQLGELGLELVSVRRIPDEG